MGEQGEVDPRASELLADVAASRGRMARASRRPVGQRVVLAVGYSLPFFVAGQDVWVITAAIAIGFLVVPVVLSRVARVRAGVAADVMSITLRTNRMQLLWAIAMALLLAATVVLVRVAHVDSVALIAGVLILLTTPFLIAAVEAVATRAIGERRPS